MADVVVDTGVIIEFIDEQGEFHQQAKLIFSAALAGELGLIIPHPVLAETYYVAARIYRELAIKEPEARATKLIEWLYRLPEVRVVEGLELALRASKLKLDFGMTLTDCYVLAAAKLHQCPAVFRRPEKEMLPNLNSLRREVHIIFLEIYQ